jgi:hypothetical protein
MSSKESLLGFEDAKALFLYEEETGFLYYKSRPLSCFKTVRGYKIWHVKCSGKRPAL